MEYEPQETKEQSGSFMERMKESPRTVSAIIIVVIVAAAIYAFSGNNQQQNAEVAVNESPTPEISVTPAPSTSVTPTTKAEVKKAEVAPKAVAVDKNVLTQQSKTLPEGKTTDNAYVEKAQKGDGLTHLARRAATRYLADNDAGYAVTNEHRIYIEDYIRKQIPKHPVAIGSEQTISFDLVKKAIESAKQLNAKQLNNLAKYTHVLR